MYSFSQVSWEQARPVLFRASLAGTFSKARSRYPWLALIPIAVMFAIMSFYIVVSGWTLNYFVDSLTGSTMLFPEYSETYKGALFYIITLAVTALVVMQGVKRGIENMSKLLVPLLFLIAVVLALFSITLPNAQLGLDFYFELNPAKLLEPGIWLMAIAQAVFSLSAGYGLMLTYASYISSKESLVKDSLIIASADVMIALLAGLFIFPAVFSFGYDPAAGATLAFTILPEIFSVMPFGGIVGALFFLLLFIAALTSCIAFIEFLTSNASHYFRLERKWAVIAVAATIGIAAIPSALSYTPTKLMLLGKPFLDAIDFYFVSLATPLSILAICVLLWSVKADDFVRELGGGPKWLWRKLYLWCKYIIPIAGLLLFAFSLYNAVMNGGI